MNRQLELIKPQVIGLAGRVPAETLLDMKVKMGTLHGKTVESAGQTYFVMYHPAAGLYTQSLVPVMEEDMRQLKSILDEKGTRSHQTEERQLHLTRFFTDEGE